MLTVDDQAAGPRDASLDHERLVLEARDVEFDWTQLPFHYVPGEPFAVVEALERIGRSSTRSQHHETMRSRADYVNGLNLYRQNMPAPLVSPGARLPRTTVAVQVLVPRRDIFVTPALQRFTGAIPAGGRVVPIEGGHWVVTSRPDVIARLAAEWVDRNVGGAAGASASQVHGVRGKIALVTGGGAGIGRATAVCPGFVNTNIAKSTVYAGMTAEQQKRSRRKADVAYRRRNFTPEATAKAIVRAVETGPAVLPVAAESWIGYAMRRISPSMVRLLARVDIRQK